MKKLLFIIALSVCALSGCGQKGPLYLPTPADAPASQTQDNS
ncbi:MAG: lipoprotein [Pseudomonadales bacterium]